MTETLTKVIGIVAVMMLLCVVCAGAASADTRTLTINELTQNPLSESDPTPLEYIEHTIESVDDDCSFNIYYDPGSGGKYSFRTLTFKVYKNDEVIGDADLTWEGEYGDYNWYAVSIYLTYNDEIVSGDIPNKEGYLFDSNYSLNGVTEIRISYNAKITVEEVTEDFLYPIATTEIKYDTNGGSGNPPGIVWLGDGYIDATDRYTTTVAAKPEGMTKSGATFLGWNTSSEGGEGTRISAGSSYTVPVDTAKEAQVITFYAEWGSPGHSVTINTSDPGISSVSYTIEGGTKTTYLEAFTVPDGKTVTLEAALNTGNSFKQWADGKTTNPYTTDAVTSDLSFNPSTYATAVVTVAKVDHTEVDGSASPSSAYAGQEVNLTRPTCAIGYECTGWTSTPTVIITNDKFTMPNPAVAVTVTPVVSAKHYLVTLDQNGAMTNGTTPVTMTYNSSAVETIIKPEKTGKTFSGWTATKDGSVIVINDAGQTVANVAGWTDADGKWINTSDDQTLYAKWNVLIASSTVSLKYNGTPIAYANAGTYFNDWGTSGQNSPWTVSVADWTPGSSCVYSPGQDGGGNAEFTWTINQPSFDVAKTVTFTTTGTTGVNLKSDYRVAEVTADFGDEDVSLTGNAGVWTGTANANTALDFTVEIVDYGKKTLTYDPNGGTGSKDVYEYDSGVVVNLDHAAYEWASGLSVKQTGWNTKADGTGDDYSLPDTSMSPTKYDTITLYEDTTLYAVWEGVDPKFEFSIPSDVTLSNKVNGKVAANVSITIDSTGVVKTKKNIVVSLDTAAKPGALSDYKSFSLYPEESYSVEGHEAVFRLSMYADSGSGEKGLFIKDITGNNVDPMPGGYLNANNNKVLLLETKDSEGYTTGTAKGYLEFITETVPMYGNKYNSILTFKVGTEEMV